jgi:hypothetical protein
MDEVADQKSRKDADYARSTAISAAAPFALPTVVQAWRQTPAVQE